MPINIRFSSKDSNNPFAEQLEFFRAKLNLPTERWDDIMRSAHDRAFVVAGAANADLLNDLRRAVDRAIEEGRGLGAFRKDFKEIVKKHGWTGWTGEGSKAGEAWRTRIIYQTNMAVSYAAGRWKQLTDPGLLAIRPYWRYMHADGVAHPRPLHVSWHGMVLAHDHKFWLTHFPPNGWGCHCWVTSADARDYEAAKAAGKGEPPEGWDAIDPKTGAPVGIDKGFDYAPGASAGRSMKDLVDAKLGSLDAPLGAALYDATRPMLQAEADSAYRAYLAGVLADPVRRGRIAVVGSIDRTTLDWLDTTKGIRPATAEIALDDGLIVGKKAMRHLLAGNALTHDEWARLPALLATPDMVAFDTRTGKLLYVIAAADPRQGKLAVEFDYKLKKGKGEVNLLVSAFKVLAETLAGDVASGVLQVIR